MSLGCPFDRPVRKTLDTVAIVGLGLIGSSIARAVRSSQAGVHVTGYDVAPQVREQARAMDLVDLVADNVQDAVRGSDLITLCVPVGAIEAVARSICGTLSPDSLVTDVGSTKAKVGAALRRALPHARIVPAHPVAGSERSGPAAGSAQLFDGRWCILTPEPDAAPEDVQAVAAFWRSLGSRVEIMSAARHDRLLAAISHVPHLLAFSAVAAVAALEQQQGQPIMKYAAGGFRDFTRIAGADPQMWSDIFLSNRQAVLETAAAFRTMSERIESLIAAADEAALLEQLESARRTRLDLCAEG